MEHKAGFSLHKLFEKENVKKIIIIIGLSGIALIFISSFFDLGSANTGAESAFSVDSYCEKLQNQLQNVISSIEGVGRADILLTIENSAEVVYEEKSEYQTKQIEPKIRGVVVVCDGGSDPVVVQRVIRALQSVLDISASKICVAQLSDNIT